MRKLCIGVFLLGACGDDGAPRDDDGTTDTDTADDADVLADYSSAQYETRAGRCPEGVYAHAGGNPANADYTTCQDLREGSSFTINP